jgi:hypothetical protein
MEEQQLDTLISEFDAWTPQRDILEELEEIWRPKWYKSLWYKLGQLFKTGKWPIRVWFIPWNREVRSKDGKLVMEYSKLDQKLFNRIHERVLFDIAEEDRFWGSFLRKK